MIEVFRTNVRNHQHALMLTEQMTKIFVGHEINFDLQDCDKILRVKCISKAIQTSSIIEFLSDHGFYAEVLEDSYS